MQLFLALCFLLTCASILGAKQNIPTVEPYFLEMLRSTGQWREFGRLLRIEDVSLLQPSKEKSENPIENVAIPYGDILLSPDQLQSEYNALNLTRYPDNRWKNGVVPYFISFTDFNASQRLIIENAIADFNSKAKGIQLKIRRPFFDKDYVMIFSGRGCYSSLGRQGGQQGLSLQVEGCVHRRLVHHEFMHAIGFFHEQNRADRDDYIQVLPENIPPEWLQWYGKVEYPDFYLIGEYDYYSTLHYRVAAPVTNKPAFIVLKDGINETLIGYGDGMTQQDIEKLNTYYPAQ